MADLRNQLPHRLARPAPRATAPRRLGAATIPLIVGLVLSGCSDDASSAPAASADPQAVQAARDNVAAFSEAQPDLEIAPLDAPPEPGMTLAVLTCPYPSCQVTSDAAEEAGQALGWNVQSYVTELTPEAIQSNFNRILQTPPDLLIYLGVLPNSMLSDELATVKRLGIHAVSVATSDPPDDTTRAVIGAPAGLRQSGELMGDSVIADSGGGAETLFVWDENTARVFQPVKDGFEGQLAAGEGSVDVLQVATQEAGRAVPAQVVTYLQAHPDVEYVAFSTADLMAGVPPALEAAGLSDVKLLSRSPLAANIENLKNGDEWVQIAEELAATGYRCVDALARMAEGSDFDESPVGWMQILNNDNVSEVSGDPTPPGFPQAFLDAWHVS